jgi:DNA-binding CsgD family transcriptional regulator
MSALVNLDTVGNLIASLGSPRFGAEYFDIFREALGIDQCTVFAFRGVARPDPVVLEGNSALMRDIAHALAHKYVAGGFEHDPNVHRPLSDLDHPTVYCMRADELRDEQYRWQFYDEPRLAHELVVLGQTGNTLYYSSFYRSDPHAGFGESDLKTMLSVARFALKALHRHKELLGESQRPPYSPMTSDVTNRAQTLSHLREVLLSEPHRLSHREAEVCAGIILGYTTLGISLNIGISINTVATHRKRAYKKLGICSQNELFSRYFQLVNQRQGTLNLSAYSQ